MNSTSETIGQSGAYRFLTDSNRIPAGDIRGSIAQDAIQQLKLLDAMAKVHIDAYEVCKGLAMQCYDSCGDQKNPDKTPQAFYGFNLSSDQSQSQNNFESECFDLEKKATLLKMQGKQYYQDFSSTYPSAINALRVPSEEYNQMILLKSSVDQWAITKKLNN